MQFQPISLTQLAASISHTIDATFIDKPIWVIAETSDIKNYTDRYYCFLSLIEKNESKITAKLEAVIWRNSYHIINKFEQNTQIKFDKNLKLLLLVNVTFSSQYGLKLSVLDIDSSYTLGNIELERKAILHRLVKENPKIIAFDGQYYFTINKQLSIPKIIRKIAIITAPNSDGQRDFLHELKNNPNSFVFEIDEYLTQIQGNGASESILKQLQNIAASKSNYDVIAIVRGGGSQTDFTAFENYNLALAIAAFPIPIITGIGHERNISIADLMSNNALKTPTKVATYIIENNCDFEEDLMQNYSSILHYSFQIIDNCKSELENIKSDLTQSTKNIISTQKQNLENVNLTLKLLSPENVLARGYAIVSKNKSIVTNGETLNENDSINIKFLNENIDAIITKKNG